MLEGHEQAQMKQNEEGLLQLMNHKVFQVLFHHVMLQELGISEGDEAVGALWNSYVTWGIWGEARGKARRNLKALSWALEPRQPSAMTRLCVDEQTEAQRNERVQPVLEPKVGLSDKEVCTVIKTLPEANLHTLGKDKFHHPKTGVLILATLYHCNATMLAITAPETVTGSPDTWKLKPIGLSREQTQFHRMLVKDKATMGARQE